MQRISTDINNVQRKEQEIQAKKIKDEKQLQEGNKYIRLRIPRSHYTGGI